LFTLQVILSSRFVHTSCVFCVAIRRSFCQNPV